MKVLMISKCPTHPTDMGSKWAILAQCKMLQQLGCEIYFLFIDERPLRNDSSPNEKAYKETKAYWGDHFFHLKVSMMEHFWCDVMKEFDFHVHKGYQSCDVNYPRHLTSMVNRLDSQFHFDICIVNYYYLTKLFENISIPKKALHTHDCFAYKDLKIGVKTLTIDANTEAKAMQRSPYIFALQDEERHYFQMLSPRSKVYNIYSKYNYTPTPLCGNHDIVFLSGGNEYNINGLRWFLRNVYPLIRKRFCDVKLVIAGSICKAIKDDVMPEGVELIGFVDSPLTLYRQGDVAINPTYQGTGLKIKTFEAVSYDKVTLVHPHSMAGVFDRPNAPLFASSKPEEWVAFLEKVWGDNPAFIPEWKARNKQYMERLNDFIINEYKRFLEE